MRERVEGQFLGQLDYLLELTTAWQFSAILGNLLTLVGLSYIRTKYRQEFSILRLNSITLILHLSLCDLLYALLGFPHFIHSHLYKTNIYSVEVCFYLGMFRNLVAYTDFNNLALISCCLARQFLCRYILCQKLDEVPSWYLGNVMAVLLTMMAMTSCLEEEESILRVLDRG